MIVLLRWRHECMVVLLSAAMVLLFVAPTTLVVATYVGLALVCALVSFALDRRERDDDEQRVIVTSASSREQDQRAAERLRDELLREARRRRSRP